MREIIPFEKKIVFPNKISSITSISLDHEEHVSDGEINGEFIVYGEYKEHLDTTEFESFKYRLPFTTIIPDNIFIDSVKVDINDFTYDLLEGDILKVIIEYKIEGEEKYIEELEDLELDKMLEEREEKVDLDEVVTPINEEDYVLYHIHIVEKNETVESIIKKYNICLDDLKEYNDISKIDIGTRLIIPYHE